MKKRKFLGLLSATIAGPALRRLPGWSSEEKLKNWAGNLTYSTQHVEQAGSVEQIQVALRASDKVKVLGTRHCFNTIADSRDKLLWLKPLHDLTPKQLERHVSIDAKAHTVTVDGGVKYGQLCPYLDARGFALHNLASLPHISIAGACSTATHGSGEANGNLASAVTALEMVTASGEVVKLSRAADGETFRGAVVGLGALGVVTKVTLQLQPAFKVRQYVYENLPLAQMKDHFDAIQESGYSVSLFTDWQKQRISELWIKSAEGSGRKAFDAPKEFFGADLAKKNLHPIAELSPENCTEQMGVPGPWYERLPHFRMGFTPSAGKELQSEYLLPRRNAIDSILAIEKLREQIHPHLLISEIRTIAADDLWMSTCYRQPSVAIHFTWQQDWPAVKRLLPVIERELGPYGARPHWGKLFTMSPAELHRRYEKLPDFLQLARKYDPKGKFRNDFLDANIFA